MLAAYAGLAAAQYGVVVAYLARGTWWHYLLHQPIGWGLGLAVAALVMAARRDVVLPPLAAASCGQLVSIVPDLMFRYARMPHTRAMDFWVGHISVHRGPSPVLVAAGVLLLGGWAWIGAAHGRRRTAVTLALSAGALLALACLLAAPLPTKLAEFS